MLAEHCFPRSVALVDKHFSCQPADIFRIRMRDSKLEQLGTLKDFRVPPWWAASMSLAPDDSPLLLRDTGIQDI